jgi:DNA-directed RNA polymerase specialized sigma24 family protein
MRVQKAEQESFPLQLYRSFLEGKTAQQLADETGISLGRIQNRLRAAKQYSQTRLQGGSNDRSIFRVQ